MPLETLFGYACLSGHITDDQATYIFPDQKRVDYWASKLKLFTEKLCVGISWKSPVMKSHRLHNYPDLSFWKPILQNEKYSFFNLQCLDFEDDLQNIFHEFGVEVINFDEIDHYNDLAEVAAFSKALDISICVTTTVSHITAAVGTRTITPTWRQSPFNNIIYRSRGRNTEFYYRNTWESWQDTFTVIVDSI